MSKFLTHTSSSLVGSLVGALRPKRRHSVNTIASQVKRQKGLTEGDVFKFIFGLIEWALTEALTGEAPTKEAPTEWLVREPNANLRTHS